MSAKTKIVVLRMKELIYTGIFVALGILLIILLIAMTICVSTVFVKQHSILDMLWGFGFSGVAWMAVYGEKTSEFFRLPFLASRSVP